MTKQHARKKRWRLRDLELVHFNLDLGSVLVTDPDGTIHEGHITGWFDHDEAETDDPDEAVILSCEIKIGGREYMPVFDVSDFSATVH